MGWDPVPGDDVDRKLAGLERLRAAGLITESAYATQRAALEARRGAAPAAPPAPLPQPPPAVPPVLPWEPAAHASGPPAARVVAALCILALLIAGGGAVFLIRRGSPTASPASGSTTTVDQFLPVAERFVEEHRGLGFTRP